MEPAWPNGSIFGKEKAATLNKGRPEQAFKQSIKRVDWYL